MVVGGVALGDQVRIDELVPLLAMRLLEADREGRQARLAHLGEQPDDQAGIDSAGEQDADRHVGDHPALHGGLQRVEQQVLPVRLAAVGVAVSEAERRVPIDAIGEAAVFLICPDRRRRQLADALEDGERRRHDRVPAHVELQRRRVDRRVDIAGGDDAGQGRGEAQAIADLAGVKRLDPEPVAGERDSAAFALVDGEGEHALEALDAVRAPGVVRLGDHFGVAIGEEAVAAALKLVAKLAIIVDAAVEDEVEAELRVDQRLRRAGRQVDDLEPLVAEADAAAHQLSAGVGPAPLLAAHHRRDGAGIGDATPETNFSGYAAHARAASLLSELKVIDLRWVAGGIAAQPPRLQIAPGLALSSDSGQSEQL